MSMYGYMAEELLNIKTAARAEVRQLLKGRISAGDLSRAYGRMRGAMDDPRFTVPASSRLGFAGDFQEGIDSLRRGGRRSGVAMAEARKRVAREMSAIDDPLAKRTPVAGAKDLKERKRDIRQTMGNEQMRRMAGQGGGPAPLPGSRPSPPLEPPLTLLETSHIGARKAREKVLA